MTDYALIVAGSGEVSEAEIYDLLNDAYPEECGLAFVVPVTKTLHTSAVKTVLGWVDVPEVYPVAVAGEEVARGTKELGEAQDLSSFSEIFNLEDFTDWDEAHFLIAMPEDESDPDYDTYAVLVEDALEAGFVVKNLCRGLDDVTLADPDETPEEPETPPEPKRGRRKPKEPEPEPVTPADAIVEAVREHADVHDEVSSAWDASKADDVLRTFLLNVRSAADAALQGLAKTPAVAAEPEATPEVAEASEKPSRGRGRPRENFEVSEIYDEDEETWVPRPKGRVSKGTQWRKIHSETGETLSEGTA